MTEMGRALPVRGAFGEVDGVLVDHVGSEGGRLDLVTTRQWIGSAAHGYPSTVSTSRPRLVRSRRETYSRMAMRRASDLDRLFRALADGTRRSMIHALARGQARSAGELGRQFHSAQPTISRHLKVLERAGLIHRSVEGRVHRFRLRQKKLEEARGWIARHQAFWQGAVERLDRLFPEPPRHAR